MLTFVAFIEFSIILYRLFTDERLFQNGRAIVISIIVAYPISYTIIQYFNIDSIEVSLIIFISITYILIISGFINIEPHEDMVFSFIFFARKSYDINNPFEPLWYWNLFPLLLIKQRISLFNNIIELKHSPITIFYRGQHPIGCKLSLLYTVSDVEKFINNFSKEDLEETLHEVLKEAHCILPNVFPAGSLVEKNSLIITSPFVLPIFIDLIKNGYYDECNHRETLPKNSAPIWKSKKLPLLDNGGLSAFVREYGISINVYVNSTALNEISIADVYYAKVFRKQSARGFKRVTFSDEIHEIIAIIKDKASHAQLNSKKELEDLIINLLKCHGNIPNLFNEQVKEILKEKLLSQ